LPLYPSFLPSFCGVHTGLCQQGQRPKTVEATILLVLGRHPLAELRTTLNHNTHCSLDICITINWHSFYTERQPMQIFDGSEYFGYV
jgi:hypothetical protein